jgi:hypothetical protein
MCRFILITAVVLAHVAYCQNVDVRKKGTDSNNKTGNTVLQPVSISSAEPLNVQGTISSMSSGANLSGAVVSIIERKTNSTVRKTTSDRQGFYEISFRPDNAKDYTLQVSFPGMRVAEIPLSAVTRKMDITLMDE